MTRPDTSNGYIAKVLAAAPFADQQAGVPQMCDLIIALRNERDALRRAADAMVEEAAALLQHVEDPDLDRAIPGQCTVCHSFRDPLHKAIRAYRATATP